MEKIYIIVSSTKTMLATSIKLVTRQPFNHASISLDQSLNECYSFGRLNPKNPIIGGFVRENFQTNPILRHSKIKILSINVSKKTFKEIHDTLHTMEKEKQDYKFNILGLFVAGLRIKIAPKNKFFCSQFVAHILAEHDITIINQEVILPHDFLSSPNCHLEHQCLAHEYPYYLNN